MSRQSYSPPRRPRLLTVNDGGRTAIIMIGPVRGPEHLEVIRTHRFYHVPAWAIAPSRLAVSCIAFYEGAARFKRKTGLIQEYAEVLTVSRVRRGDLPGLTWPGRRGEEASYYRFDLGPLQTLPRPITNPDHLRVVFRFPDMQQLRQAETLRSLGGRRAGNRTGGAGVGAPRVARGRKGAGKT
ncbi:MAG TPA: hypothetical protein VLT62_12445 [Candidatus Methylomirabilis sp.]|nr:hypothetical protein [Candidatus Methylomirabilis sp.]